MPTVLIYYLRYNTSGLRYIVGCHRPFAYQELKSCVLPVCSETLLPSLL